MHNMFGRSLLQPSLGVTRREMIRIGGLSMAGIGLSDLVAQAGTVSDADRAKHGPGFGRAKNCIILFLSG